MTGSVATTEGDTEAGMEAGLAVEAMIAGGMTVANAGGATTGGSMGEGFTIGRMVTGGMVKVVTIAAGTSLSAQWAVVSRIGAVHLEVEADIQQQ